MSRQDALRLLFTAFALIFAFPPFPTGFIAVIAWVPFYFFLEGKKAGEAFRGGYIVGLLWAGGTIYWIGWATGWGLLGILLILPLYFAVYAATQVWLWKRWGHTSLWTAPFVWIGFELLASTGILSFPWNLLGYTQTYTPVMIQYASITGVYGVSFWVVLLNVLIYQLWTRRNKGRETLCLLIAIFLMILLPWVHGRFTFDQKKENTQEIKLALIQGNIDPYIKWTPSFIDSNFAVYRRLTWDISDHHPDLIVWPETATPCYLRYSPIYLDYVRSQVDSLGIPLLTGSPDYEHVDEQGIKTYNGALLIHPNSRVIDRYHKMHLVPFSERVPFVDQLPFLYDWGRKMDLDIGNFEPGDSVVVFRAINSQNQAFYFSVVICYESVYPYLVRKFVEKGTQFLVIITNDGWFGTTSGPYQHAQIAVFRAIENRLWIARCANTGISEFIDPYGVIHAKTKLNEESVLIYSIFSKEGDTFFLKHGQVISLFILVVNVFILLMALFGNRLMKKLRSCSVLRL
ncbi:apolipoprotein N-acyltransferase [bacterium]|nr:apolipoprotein N-acyltransferase [bacterium]